MLSFKFLLIVLVCDQAGVWSWRH